LGKAIWRVKERGGTDQKKPTERGFPAKKETTGQWGGEKTGPPVGNSGWEVPVALREEGGGLGHKKKA